MTPPPPLRYVFTQQEIDDVYYGRRGAGPPPPPMVPWGGRPVHMMPAALPATYAHETRYANQGRAPGLPRLPPGIDWSLLIDKLETLHKSVKTLSGNLQKPKKSADWACNDKQEEGRRNFEKTLGTLSADVKKLVKKSDKPIAQDSAEDDDE